MPDNNHSTPQPSSAEEAGLSPTPTIGLSGDGATQPGLYTGTNDPNAAAMDQNAEAAQKRQLTGEPPGTETAQNPGGLPSAQSEVFEEGT